LIQSWELSQVPPKQTAEEADGMKIIVEEFQEEAKAQ
jgi:hypothetical protein